MGLKSINEHIVEDITKEVLDSIKGIGEKYGLDLHIGNAEYSNTSFVLHLQGVLNGVACVGKIREKRQKHWELNCDNIGMKPSDFGLKLQYDGNVWEITGLDLTQKDNPIILQKEDYTALRTSKAVIDYMKQCNGINS